MRKAKAEARSRLLRTSAKSLTQFLRPLDSSEEVPLQRKDKKPTRRLSLRSNVSDTKDTERMEIPSRGSTLVLSLLHGSPSWPRLVPLNSGLCHQD